MMVGYISFQKRVKRVYDAICESSSLYVWSLPIINESIMLYQLNWYLLWQFNPAITHSASFWFLTSHSCSYFDHKLKWVIETSDVCTWQIKDDTKRQVYCALIKLLQDKNLSVRVCCMCPFFFCTSPLLLFLHGYDIFLPPNSLLLYPVSIIEVLHSL